MTILVNLQSIGLIGSPRKGMDINFRLILFDDVHNTFYLPTNRLIA